MTSMRRLICGMILCGMAPLALAADKAAPAEKQFALPAGGSLVLKWTSGWADLAPPPGVPPGTVAFSGPDAAKMRALVVPVPPEAGITSDPESLKALTSNVALELAKSG